MINLPAGFLSEDEWEMLCDCCGLCCLYKVQDQDTGEVFYTSVVCPLLDRETARCTDYAERFKQMPSCTKISAENLRKIAWLLRKSIAFLFLAEGVWLPVWHQVMIVTSPEAEALRDKLAEYCIRPNTCITRETIRQIIQNSFAPRSFRKLNRLLLANVIEDIDI